MPQRYIEKILRARVYDVARETPLDRANRLSLRLDNEVFLKREDLQPVFSFKLRGAYNKMVNLPDSVKRQGVVAASAGNHAQGVALAAQKLKIQALIVMPKTTPPIKVQSVKSYGAKIILAGDSYDAAYARAQTIAQEGGLTFIHPFDDAEVIAGQGTIAMELLRQHPLPPRSGIHTSRWRWFDCRHRRLYQICLSPGGRLWGLNLRMRHRYTMHWRQSGA